MISHTLSQDGSLYKLFHESRGNRLQMSQANLLEILSFL